MSSERVPVTGWNYIAAATVLGVAGLVILSIVGIPSDDTGERLAQLAGSALVAIAVTLWLIGSVAVGVTVGNRTRPPQP